METKEKRNAQLDQSALEQKVKKMYHEVALHPEVTYHFEMGRDLAMRLGYPRKMLDKIPKPAIDSFAGVGYYFDLLQINKGDTVLDLGSGSGMDVFYAALKVGESGKVIGIDMTDAQLEKAMHLADKHEFPRVYFQKAYIEELPIIANTIDAVISNGVINLSPNKRQVFEEAARVLKPGGKLAISDIVTTVPLPENISCNATLWAACIGGAMQIDEYKALIENAGLSIVESKENPYAFISENAKGASLKYGIQSISLCAVK